MKIDPGSQRILDRAVADRLTRERFGNEAIVLGQIGIDISACPIKHAGLDWYYGCEPVGPEHDSREHLAVHEPNLIGLTSGANVVYAETGANPHGLDV